MSNRKLDALVGERVFAYRVQNCGTEQKPLWRLVDATGKRVRDDWTWFSDEPWNACPDFSSDIAAAWTIVEKLTSDGNDMEIEAQVKPRGVLWGVTIEPMTHWGTSIESTALLAICVAALRAVGVTEDEIREATIAA